MLVFGQPDIQQPEIDEVIATLKSTWLGTGPRTARFERAFAAYKGVAHTVALNSCTSALMLAIRASGIGPGDEVITTPLTFCATVNSILHAGATPVLVDVESDTMNLDVAQIESKITERTRAILPVHFAGRPCQMDEILRISADSGLKVIEDCAHAIEATWNGQHVGTTGNFGCFSFYATKNITTGEGGMITARDPEALSRIKTLALHGLTRDAWKRFGDDGYKHYHVVDAGYKCNMTDLQAAIGLPQLARIESNWQLREAIWKRYNLEFVDLPLVLPLPVQEGVRHAYHLYTILLDEHRTRLSRDEFLDAMTQQNIGVGVHYVGLPEHPYYRDRLGWRPEDYPHATRIGRQTVSLPLSPGLTDDDVDDVVLAVRRIFGA
jgi:dTDP-4-amino-4,6-dideoxygalactose transaminase